MTAFLHVLVPAYGPSPYLAQTLASVLRAAGQAPDGATMAVTVVDDGSQDDAVATTTEAAGTGVEYVRLPENLGVAGAFQACADLSRGTYTVIMGSDDLLEEAYPARIHALVGRFGPTEFATTGVTVIDGAGAQVRPLPDRVKSALAPSGDRPRLLGGDRLVSSLLTGNWLYFPAVAWRTDVLGAHGFRPDMETALDLDLELRVLFAGGSLAWAPESAFRYRRHSSSVSSRSAVSGDRFAEERRLFAWAATEAKARRWRRSAVAARVQATSRLHRLLGAAARLRGRGSVVR